MKKIDLNERLSPRNTMIAVLAILLAVTIGFTVAVLWHQTYLKNRKAEITNIANRPLEEQLFAYNETSPVYVYKAGTTSVALADVIEVSKGATYSVTKVLNTSLDVLPIAVTFDVSEGQTYYVFIKVVSEGHTRVRDYVLEITGDLGEKGAIPDSNELPEIEIKAN